jgi:hypothetical protein
MKIMEIMKNLEAKKRIKKSKKNIKKSEKTPKKWKFGQKNFANRYRYRYR